MIQFSLFYTEDSQMSPSPTFTAYSPLSSLSHVPTRDNSEMMTKSYVEDKYFVEMNLEKVRGVRRGRDNFFMKYNSNHLILKWFLTEGRPSKCQRAPS